MCLSKILQGNSSYMIIVVIKVILNGNKLDDNDIFSLPPPGEVFDYLVAHGRMKEKEARAKFRQVSHQLHRSTRTSVVIPLPAFRGNTACTKIKLRHQLQRKDGAQIAWPERTTSLWILL